MPSLRCLVRLDARADLLGRDHHRVDGRDCIRLVKCVLVVRGRGDELRRQRLLARLAVADRSVGDLEGDDGDVVVAAATVRLAYECAQRIVDVVPMALDDAEDLLLAEHVCQPVRAEQEEVARLRGHAEGVDVDVGVGAERARDHRLLRMRFGFLARQLPAFHQLVDERVILRQLLDPSVADEVRA